MLCHCVLHVEFEVYRSTSMNDGDDTEWHACLNAVKTRHQLGSAENKSIHFDSTSTQLTLAIMPMNKGEIIYYKLHFFVRIFRGNSSFYHTEFEASSIQFLCDCNLRKFRIHSNLNSIICPQVSELVRANSYIDREYCTRML